MVDTIKTDNTQVIINMQKQLDEQDAEIKRLREALTSADTAFDEAINNYDGKAAPRYPDDYKAGFKAGQASRDELLRECLVQLEYLHEKFPKTGTTEQLLTKIQAETGEK